MNKKSTKTIEGKISIEQNITEPKTPQQIPFKPKTSKKF